MSISKKYIFISEALMSISLVCLVIVFQCGLPLWTFLIKTLTSIIFVAIGCLGYIGSDKKSLFSRFMLSALISSMAGDVLLAFNRNEGIIFILGVASFALAHILFSVAYSNLMPVCRTDILGATMLFTILMLILAVIPFLDFKGLLPAIIVYSLIISFMVIKALMLLKLRTEYRKGILAVSAGSLMFLLSDIVLLFWLFGINTPKEIQSVNWIIYYLAQGLLSYSISEIR